MVQKVSVRFPIWSNGTQCRQCCDVSSELLPRRYAAEITPPLVTRFAVLQCCEYNEDLIFLVLFGNELLSLLSVFHVKLCLPCIYIHHYKAPASQCDEKNEIA